MIALPFTYFSIWFIAEYRKRGLDVYSFMILLYAITSFFSILIDRLDLYDNHSCVKYPSLGFVAPILYVTLLTICIQPFSRFKSNSIQKMVGRISERKFDLIVYAYFVMFLIVLIVSMTRIEEILTSNALADIRGEQYRRETVIWYNHLGGFLRNICGVCHTLAPSSFIMIPFFFIGLFHFHKGLLFSAMAICGSISMLLIAINIVDRSNFVYWGLTFVFCYILFRNHLSKGAKYKFSVFAIVMGTIMLFYFINVTVSRFGERESGTSGGMIIYAGQSYINFCNFFNHLIFEVPHKPEIVLLPNINRYILHGPNYFEFTEELSKTYHHTVANFSSFLGFIMSVSGLWITIIYCFAYNFVVRVFLKPHRNIIGIKQFAVLWIFALNPILGLFCYYYWSPNAVLAAFVWWIIGVSLTPKATHKNF